MDQRCSSVEEVHQCTLWPNKFRIRARIIEYYPRHVADFLMVECNLCGKMYVTSRCIFELFSLARASLDTGYHLCPDCGDLRESSTTVRYQFAIRVADQSGEININVGHDEAVSNKSSVVVELTSCVR